MGGGGGVCGAMHSTSCFPLPNSAESIYGLLCAVQTQANKDDEEIKALRLRISKCERDVQRTQAEICEFSHQLDTANEGVRGNCLILEEKKMRHAGAVEVLRDTEKQVSVVIDAFWNCKLPLHPAAKGMWVESRWECLSPVVIRSATVSLKQKIEEATAQQRQSVTRLSQCFLSAAHETGVVDGDSGDAGRSFAVRFRREDATSLSTREPVEVVGVNDGIEEGQNVFSSIRQRRKSVTFNDARLEVHVNINGTTADAATRVCTGMREKEGISSARGAALVAALGGKRAPRRTIWQTGSRKQS